MKLDHTILREVGNLSRAIKTFNDVKFSHLDLHKNQYIFLTRICENTGISPKALSIMLRVDKTTTTKAVQKLIANDYIRKEKDSSDARGICLYPTEKALEVYKEIISEENKVLDFCFEGFSEEEIKLAHELIKRMNDNYEDHWYQAKNYKGSL
ncbi:winged helix-turn-helix transcriptional regulator [Acidaminobacter sp. JC074]|uniref:MarR family winged helix-turn-helix transcriptional regulator n=1 Tax=Acidaminobacter sp. JC074 TaxID=2530199 RepID=UPI001F0FDAB6|nr:MarR family winged helix-turn-helix transcriptional regulator [Acidaminobacter sp. JC074]MCH4891081.1 winged helix-turn-helix transcriptional regulator [Acidaminobacter sp. JC074]